MKRTLLLDADILAYRIAATAQTSTQFPGCEAHVEVDPWEEVVPRIQEGIDELLERLDADRAVLCVSVPTEEGWRRKVLPTYKDHRKSDNKPRLLGRVKQAMVELHGAYLRPTLEADDILGILSTHPKLEGPRGSKIVVSDDKDLGTIPGLWFRPGWVGGGDMLPREVTRADADRFHLYQTLAGDATDGYSGCPGIGPKKAAQALDKEPSWASVVSVYASRGLTEADALIQARVARICRSSDYDFPTKTVRLWTPDAF